MAAGGPGAAGRGPLVAGLMWWAVAGVVVALALGYMLLYAFACSKGPSDCSNAKMWGLLWTGVAVSSLPLWPASVYLFRWRTQGAVTARWRGPAMAAALALYAYGACVAVLLLTAYVHRTGWQGLMWLASALSWVAFGLWLVSILAARAHAGSPAANR